MKTQTCGLTICAALAMVSMGWAQNTAPKKFRTTTPRPYHSSKDVGTGQPHKSAPNVVSPKTQSARQSEVDRLERQNAMHLQAQARQHSGSKANPQASKIRPEPAGHSSGINFSYHPPHTQSAGTSGAHKH